MFERPWQDRLFCGCPANDFNTLPRPHLKFLHMAILIVLFGAWLGAGTERWAWVRLLPGSTQLVMRWP